MGRCIDWMGFAEMVTGVITDSYMGFITAGYTGLASIFFGNPSKRETFRNKLSRRYIS
jgi:hypothetical protein